jgi:hypothetical protein
MQEMVLVLASAQTPIAIPRFRLWLNLRQGARDEIS